MENVDAVTEFFGEPISVYTRAQAIADGVLVDVTEWASAEKGFHGGFRCPVAFTANLWAAIDRKTAHQDTRGRAHDVLWMSSLALRGATKRGENQTGFKVLLQVARTKAQILRVVADGDGVTIGFPADF